MNEAEQGKYKKTDVFAEMFNDKAKATNEYVQWFWLSDLLLHNYVWNAFLYGV